MREKTALDALREAQHAQAEHDKRIDVQLSLLTIPTNPAKVDFISDGGDQDVEVRRGSEYEPKKGGLGLHRT